jgi:hypothetical protein
MPINNSTPMDLQPFSGASEPPGKTKHFTGSASNEWVTPFYGKVLSPPAHHGNDMQHRIPGAGPVILRISKQAQAHPHVTGVLKLFSPQF